MNLPIFFAAAAAESTNPVAEVAKQFHLEWNLLISQMVLFVILAVLLKKFAFGPVLEMLEARRQRIAESLENADRIRKELAEAETSRQQIMDKANEEAGRLIEEAKAAANKVREAETRKAQSEAEQIIAKAREAMSSERDQMLEELRAEVGQLVVNTTEKVLDKSLNQREQQRLLTEARKEVAA